MAASVIYPRPPADSPRHANTRFSCCGRPLTSIAPSASARDGAQVEELRSVLQRLAHAARSQHPASAMPRLSPRELLSVATKADLILCPEKMLLFLQGDFGSSYFVVLSGSVDLFVENNKEKEMRLARELGDLRMKSIADPAGTLPMLGAHVTALGAGCGFGEFAILNRARRFRGASAVVDSGSALLVVHEECYVTDIQRYHLRQQRMAQGLQLLQEVPWLGDVNYATLGQLAYTMTFSAIPAKTVVVRAGDVVENIYLVARGFVTMYPSRYMSRGARKGGDGVVRSGGEGSCCSLKLAVVMRGRGCVLGEREFRGGVVAYEHTYEAAEETEVFALPRSALEGAMFQKYSHLKITRVLNPTQHAIGCTSPDSEDAIGKQLERALRAQNAVSSAFGTAAYRERTGVCLAALATALHSVQSSLTISPTSTSAVDASFHTKSSRSGIVNDSTAVSCKSSRMHGDHFIEVSDGSELASRPPTSPPYPPPSHRVSEASPRMLGSRTVSRGARALAIASDSDSLGSPTNTCAFRPFKISFEAIPKLAYDGAWVQDDLLHSTLASEVSNCPQFTGASSQDVVDQGVANTIIAQPRGSPLGTATGLNVDKITRSRLAVRSSPPSLSPSTTLSPSAANSHVI